MNTAFACLANWILSHRIVVFCVILLTLGISFVGMGRLEIALSPRAFVASDSPEGRGLDRFFAVWGADEDVVIAVADGGESTLLTPVLGEFLFMQRLAYERVHRNVIAVNSCRDLRVEVEDCR